MATRYRPPGVSVTIIDNPGTLLLPAGLRIPNIIATGLTTLLVKNAQVTRASAGDTDTIPSTSSGDVSEIKIVGDFPDEDQYEENVDWRQVDNTILWISGGQSPTAGSTYSLTYRKPKASSFYDQGVLYTDMQAVRDDFGDEIINGVLTPLSAAAKLCFDNGATAILIIQAQTASQTDLQSAITAAKQEDIDVMVVPQACNTTLNTYMKAHVLGESSPEVRHWRVQFRGADGLSDAVTTIRSQAQNMANERITVVAPPAFVSTFYDATADAEQDVLLPSSYMAAAYAGIIANPNNDAATPPTRKALIGIKNLSTFDYSKTDKDLLGAAGVTVIENQGGTIRIRHALTTDTSNVSRLSQSIVFIKDNVRKELSTRLDQSFIGVKADNTVKSRIAAEIEAFLRLKVRDEIITAFRNIKVTQSTTDPRTFSVSFDMAPVYPIEYVDVTISLVT